jgi:transcriptional regulator with XRE-family HTH domain
VTSRDVVRIARQRAGLTQQQLAKRSGHPRETIARWETGAREPSLSALKALVAASGLDLVLHLAEHDASLDQQVSALVGLSPSKRLDNQLPAPALRELSRAFDWIAAAETPLIVIGSIGATLQGAPQRPDASMVEVVSADPHATEREMRASGLAPIDNDDRWADRDRREGWMLPRGGVIALALDLPGSAGYPDLRREAERLRLDDGKEITVAHPRDLFRLADASSRAAERARIPGLRALLAQREAA